MTTLLAGSSPCTSDGIEELRSIGGVNWCAWKGASFYSLQVMFLTLSSLMLKVTSVLDANFPDAKPIYAAADT